METRVDNAHADLSEAKQDLKNARQLSKQAAMVPHPLLDTTPSLEDLELV